MKKHTGRFLAFFLVLLLVLQCSAAAFALNGAEEEPKTENETVLAEDSLPETIENTDENNLEGASQNGTEGSFLIVDDSSEQLVADGDIQASDAVPGDANPSIEKTEETVASAETVEAVEAAETTVTETEAPSAESAEEEATEAPAAEDQPAAEKVAEAPADPVSEETEEALPQILAPKKLMAKAPGLLGATAGPGDTTDAVNYDRVLGRAAEYGILADTYEQANHAQTNFAVKQYIYRDKNNDPDLAGSHIVPFIIGELKDCIKFGGSTYNHEKMQYDIYTDVKYQEVIDKEIADNKQGDQRTYVKLDNVDKVTTHMIYQDTVMQ